MKFVQRVILVQTRGVSDPRVVVCSLSLYKVMCIPEPFVDFLLQLQNKNDPNLSFCPADHPFIQVAKLESEGQKLLEGVITILFTSQWVK
jgi:symplekin